MNGGKQTRFPLVSRGRVFSLFVMGLVSSGHLTAQVPQFEVASVKIVSEETLAGRLPPQVPSFQDQYFRGGPGSNSPGRIDYGPVTLRMLLERAYSVRPEQITGPAWLSGERYQVLATLPGRTTPEELRVMLQGLLADRFKVELHRERKSLPVYRLVVAKNGPKLVKLTASTEPKAAPEDREAAQKKAAELMKKVQAGLAAARAQNDFPVGFSRVNATIAEIARDLSFYAGRPVIDATGLSGSYSMELKWAPDQRPPEAAPGPSLFTALEEQLGLALVSDKADLEMIVVDSAQRVPVDN